MAPEGVPQAVGNLTLPGTDGDNAALGRPSAVAKAFAAAGFLVPARRRISISSPPAAPAKPKFLVRG